MEVECSTIIFSVISWMELSKAHLCTYVNISTKEEHDTLLAARSLNINNRIGKFVHHLKSMRLIPFGEQLFEGRLPIV